jgi:hypothetical protein
LTRAEAGVNQDASFVGFEVGAVAGRTASKNRESGGHWPGFKHEKNPQAMNFVFARVAADGRNTRRDSRNRDACSISQLRAKLFLEAAPVRD